MKPTLLLIAMLFTSVANAQEITNASVCSELMKYGIYDEHNMISDREKFALTKAFICRSTFSTYEQAVQTAQASGISINIFDLIDFGSAENRITARHQWATWREHFCQMDYAEVRERILFMSSVRTISPALMEAVKTCLNNSQHGLRAWVEPNRLRTSFTFNVRYVQIGSEKAKVDENTAYSPASLKAKCSGTDRFKKHQVITAATRSMTCNGLDPTKTYSIIVHTDQGDRPVTLDPVPPKPTATISADKTIMKRGERIRLSWTSENANTFKLVASDNTSDIFSSPAGTLEKTPTANITYSLLASGPEDDFITSPVSISVTTPPPTAFLGADKTVSVSGSAVRLSWRTTDASLVTIDNGIGTVATPAEGSIEVRPTRSTTYSLTAVGNVPPATYSVAINVLPKLTVWRNVNFGGEAYDVFEPGEFGGVLRTEASSIKVNTDQWVALEFRGGAFGTVKSFLLVKGPKHLSNLHTIRLEGFEGENAHWADKYIKVIGFLSDSQAQTFRNDPFTVAQREWAGVRSGGIRVIVDSSPVALRD
jgi:hypothetical protein